MCAEKVKLNEEYKEILAAELNIQEIKFVKKLSSYKIIEVNNFKVSLDLNLTAELKEKGIIRELIRFINNLRKEAGLIVKDNPIETYNTSSEYLKNIIKNNKEELIKSTSAQDIREDKNKSKFSKEVKINEEKIILGLKID